MVGRWEKGGECAELGLLGASAGSRAKVRSSSCVQV